MSDQVVVQMPIVNDDLVVIPWTDRYGEQAIWFRYEGINCQPFSPQLWLEIWLGLQLRAYRHEPTPLRIQLPMAIPERVARFWSAYYYWPKVEIRPLSNESGYSPFSDERDLSNHFEFDAGVYLGGGRDSLATSGLLGEIYGRDRVLLLHSLDPNRTDEVTLRERRENRNRLLLDPLERAGFAVQRVETNLQEVSRNSRDRYGKFHVEQYTLVHLPALLARGVRLSTFCFAWFEYAMNIQPDGRARVRWPSSRPEVLAAQSRHYQQTFGFPHQVADVNLTLADRTAFRILVDRFPDILPNILMCLVGGENRWCLRCRKCAMHARNCLDNHWADPGFDASTVMTSSNWITETLAYLNALETPPAPGENAPYNPALSLHATFAHWCNYLHDLDPVFARSYLNDDAFFNVELLKTFYGNRYDPKWDGSPQQSFDFLPPDLGAKLAAIISRYQTIVPRQEGLLHTGYLTKAPPFSQEIRHPVLELKELQ